MPPSIRKHCVRYNEPCHAHELTFSCYRRLPLLSPARTCRWLADSIAAARVRMQFDLWAYVFMPGHVHLLIYPRRPEYSISAILAQIKRPVAQQALGYLAKSAPEWLARLTVSKKNGRVERRFWQAGGGYDRNLIEPATIRLAIEYIHANPVRRGLVQRPEDWPWSSAGYYFGQPARLLIDATLAATIGD